MTRIATLTLNPTVDKSCDVDQVVPERKLRCGEPRFDPGGGGINVARVIKELGGEVTAFWMGGGTSGDLLEQLLNQAGLEQVRFPIRAHTRENLIVYEESSGLQYRFGMPGASLMESEITLCLDRLKALDPAPEYFVLSGSLPPGIAEDIYARIGSILPSGCRIVLDTSGRAFPLGLESPVFLIKPNIRELGELAGKSIRDDAEIRDASRALIAQGKVQVVATSLGSGGVVLTTADHWEHIRAPTVTIRSKVGAGDSMVGGIVLALVRGENLSNAVRFGVAAGSAAVMTVGTELCRRKDTERLYQQLIKP